VLEVVDRERPLHLSIVGGDPLVRFRELETLLPQLVRRRIFVQLVTSAFRPIPASWATLPRFHVVVSIDGLQPEHDARRKPATYERILKNIAGHSVIIHCTITAQMMQASGYLEEFLRFWCPRPEIRKIWMSIFTPQRGASSAECLSDEQRGRAIHDLMGLREAFQKLDMSRTTLLEFAAPPRSPEACIFARTTRVISADLTTTVKPCQFGGDPDCSRCGCVASMGLAAVGHHRIAGLVPVGSIYMASARIGAAVATVRERRASSQKRAPRHPSVSLVPRSDTSENA
jgi:sulfatase maturation enzyme AslB (radical SAM superfamily)